MTAPAITPVTVIGGFLGGGKTTFLNHLLRTGNARYAVLVNDFGAVNIDAGLIARHDGTTMSLTNGCVCCSIGGGFIETLGKLLDGETRFDHIVIEASGVGDPWRIAEIALVEPSLRLNAVVVIADVSRTVALLADPKVGDTVRNQFERCDVVLLNKADLVDEARMDTARDAVLRLRDGLRIVETSQLAMPELSALTPERAIGRFRADAVTAGRVDHESTFQRWVYRRESCFDRMRLEAALRQLPPQLLRLKGSCSLEDEDGISVLQMAGGAWSLTRAGKEEFRDMPAILLTGVGTADLPPSAELDRILDSALAARALRAS
jgi:G3E family GTPase